MRTPRTVDEIADAILPPSIDGIHERALCLLLAEHEADIARLRDQLPKLPPGEWTREKVADFNASPAPGSAPPAPTANDVRQVVLWMRKVNAYNAAGIIEALAADRDRLAAELDETQLVYAEVARREAGLRANREYWRTTCIEAQQHRDGANAQVAELERDLVAARTQLAAATDLCDRLAAELRWCSGSADFNSGGQARIGWVRGPQVVLAEYEEQRRAAAEVPDAE